MVSRTQRDPNTYVLVTTFMATAPTSARTWGRNKFTTIFPNLNTTTPATLDLSSLETTLATLLQALKPQLVGNNTTTVQQQPGPTEVNVGDKLGMCKTELELFCKYCGLQSNQADFLLDYLVLINKKNVSDTMKDQFLITRIRDNEYYDNDIVPITQPLLKMIKKRKFLSDDPDLTFQTATKCFTIFSVGPMEEDDIAIINKLYEYIQEASMITTTDIKNLAKVTAKVPGSTEKFMDTLRVFANALYALFTAGCPLFLQMKEIMRAPKKYNQRARSQMAKKT